MFVFFERGENLSKIVLYENLFNKIKRKKKDDKVDVVVLWWDGTLSLKWFILSSSSS